MLLLTPWNGNLEDGAFEGGGAFAFPTRKVSPVFIMFVYLIFVTYVRSVGITGSSRTRWRRSSDILIRNLLFYVPQGD